MAYLSKQLLNYLSNPQLSEQAPIRVVVRLDTAPGVTFDRVPRTQNARSRMTEVLRATGVGNTILNTVTFQPQRMVQGVSTMSLQVKGKDLQELARTPGIEYVRPARMHRMYLNASVGLVGLDNDARPNFDGTGVRVAVIDSGIDHNHPDLRGRVNLALSRNFTDEGAATDVTDGNGHGTHVAGIIGGAGATYRGVAPGVEFISCKVFTSSGNPTDEGAIVAAARWAMEKGAHVINYSGGYAPVFTGPAGNQIALPPPWVWPAELVEEEAEFQRAMDLGTVAVVSAGNWGEIGRRGTISVPATSPSVISVGSVDKRRQLSTFSSVGPVYRSTSVTHADFVATLDAALKPTTRSYPELDMLAPGGGTDEIAAHSGGCFYLPGIISGLSANANEEEVCLVDNQYVRMSGTSQAAPHIAGLAALLLHAAREMNIDLGQRRAYVAKGILRTASERLPEYRPAEQGRGLPTWPRIEQILGDIAAGRIRIGRFARQG